MIIATPLALIAAAMFATAPLPAAAQPLPKGVTVAHLAKPLSSPTDPVLDGRIWHCEGSTCQANPTGSARGESIARECSAAAQKIGAFDSYQSGAEMLDGDALAKCNAQARKR